MPVLLLPHALAQHRFYTELYSVVPTDSVAQCRLLNLLDNKLADDQRVVYKGGFWRILKIPYVSTPQSRTSP